MSDLRPMPLPPAAVPRSQARRLRIAVVTDGLPGGSPNPPWRETGQLLEHLRRRGHDTVLICPGKRNGTLPDSVAGAPVVPVPSMSLRGHPVGLPYREVMRALGAFAPDVVHLDAPLQGGAAAGLGAAVLGAASQLGVPTLAVENPWDQPGSADPVRTGLIGGLLRRRLFGGPDLTVQAPVDRFSPRRGPESLRLRQAWAPGAEVVVGYWNVPLVGVAGTVTIRLGEPAGGAAGLRELHGLDELHGSHELHELHGSHGLVEDARLPSVLAALDLLVIGPPVAYERALAVGSPAVHESALLVERALASGVPVIAPADGRELVRPGLDGLAYRDAAELERCVADLAGDAHRRHWAGMAATSGARRRSRERFNDELIAGYRRLIDQLVDADAGIG